MYVIFHDFIIFSIARILRIDSNFYFHFLGETQKAHINETNTEENRCFRL